MEIKLDGAWPMVDSWVQYMISWFWWASKAIMAVVVVCLVLGGVKEMLMIGPWVPDVGPPTFWAWVAGTGWLVSNWKK